LNQVDPKAWLAFVLAKLPDHPAKRIDELLPWNWKAARDLAADTVSGRLTRCEGIPGPDSG
jgi:hypothetical protein